ncbi:MAG: HTH domain-containing protein, partial [Gorillibacterium sp.]|nr:HTH domain-containing protein [Gorillibacterium sp.]
MAGNNRNILAVDDEPKILEAVSSFLESRGFTVFSAINGRQAFEIFDRENISLILLDLMLPVISGEEICRRLDVSRTAIWKHIQALREDGYEIEARPRAGYQLVKTPDRLYPEEIGDGLATSLIGRRVYYCESVSSTNDLAKQLARGDAGEGTLVVAEEQQIYGGLGSSVALALAEEDP